MQSKKIFIATILAGAVSLVTFGLERLALTDIFHGEPDLRLEWTVVNMALLPIVVFHILALLTAGIAMRQLGRCGSAARDAARRAGAADRPSAGR